MLASPCTRHFRRETGCSGRRQETSLKGKLLWFFSAHTGSQEWLVEDACPMLLWAHGLWVRTSIGCVIILSCILWSCRISSFILACTPYWFFHDADGKLPQVNHTCLEVGQSKMQNAKISSPKLSAPLIPVLLLSLHKIFLSWNHLFFDFYFFQQKLRSFRISFTYLPQDLSHLFLKVFCNDNFCLFL